MYALVLAEAESFRPDLGVAHSVPRVYWHGFPNSVMREAIEALRAAGQTDGLAAIDPENLPFSCADELVTTAIDGATFHEAKVNAMRAYASQISLDSGFFALNATPTSTTLMSEYFRLVRGEVSGVLDEKGRETDLFAGLR
jgi:N-acetyl-1-D-myo-inositol-2-amino-2-deoxy-alpha-D-glucopyranoside deacetylase